MENEKEKNLIRIYLAGDTDENYYKVGVDCCIKGPKELEATARAILSIFEEIPQLSPLMQEMVQDRIDKYQNPPINASSFTNSSKIKS